MSVISRNPFDLLGDDGESASPASAPKPTPAAASAAGAKKPQTTKPGQERTIPGSNAGAGAARGGRGQGNNRGGARPNYRAREQQEGEPRNTGPTSGDGVVSGFENAGGFDGERVAPSKKYRHGPDAHTKGPRENRPIRNQTSGGHTSSGAGRGGRTPNFGGERRQFERRSGTVGDSQKKVEHGWGSNEGAAELTAEVEGEKDAVAEENTPQTPAPEGEDGGWGAPEASADAPAATAAAEEAEPEEPEEIQKSYDEFLAEKAAQQLQFGKKEGRSVNAETLEGKAFVRETIDEFFSGKEKTAAAKAKAPKKEKVFIEVDGQFASPAGGRPTRGTGDRGGRGGRGAGRGGDRGGRGGPRGGRGGPRGGARGGFGGQAATIDASNEKAFPALGA